MIDLENIGKQVDETTRFYDGFFRVICGDFGKTKILSADGVQNDLFLTLKDFETWARYMYNAKEGEFLPSTITVIHENALDGEVFCYGNHGDFWEKIGVTCGYA